MKRDNRKLWWVSSVLSTIIGVLIALIIVGFFNKSPEDRDLKVDENAEVSNITDTSATINTTNFVNGTGDEEATEATLYLNDEEYLMTSPLLDDVGASFNLTGLTPDTNYFGTIEFDNASETHSHVIFTTTEQPVYASMEGTIYTQTSEELNISFTEVGGEQWSFINHNMDLGSTIYVYDVDFKDVGTQDYSIIEAYPIETGWGNSLYYDILTGSILLETVEVRGPIDPLTFDTEEEYNTWYNAL